HEAALLLLLADFQPDLEQPDAAIDHVLLDDRAELEEALMLLGCAEAHDVLDAGAVVPAAIEDHDLAGRREVLHVALHVHLGLLPVRGRGQGEDAKDARAHACRHRLDQATLAGGIATLADDDDSLARRLAPVLQMAELDLELVELLLVLLALQFLAVGLGHSQLPNLPYRLAAAGRKSIDFDQPGQPPSTTETRTSTIPITPIMAAPRQGFDPE